MIDATQLNQLEAPQLREMVRSLISTVVAKDREIAFKQATIDKITHEMAVLKRLKFAAKSEQFNAEQKSLLEETIDADLAALQAELDKIVPGEPDKGDKRQPKREKLPAHLPRREIHHEPENTTCACGCALKRIGQDVAEKLDYAPGVFTVERHVRGKWVCAHCETLVQAAGGAAHHRQGHPHERAAGAGAGGQVPRSPAAVQAGTHLRARRLGASPRSTLAQWVGECGAQLQPLVDALTAQLLTHGVLHADETPVAMLKPGNGKTHRAYLWSYCTSRYNDTKAVVFDFAESRAGQHARNFLGLPGDDGWHGKLVCDDYSGYKQLLTMGVTEAGCLAHARRKFFDLWANHKSQVAEEALKYFVQLYEVEREVQDLASDERRRIRQLKARPLADALNKWLTLQRQKVPDGSATAKAIDYSLGRWVALTRYLDDGDLPADNNWVENQIRPIALGRNNWLFAGSLRAGKRAAAVMSLVHSARLNGHDPYAYLKDVLERLPTQPASRVLELLPHHWQPSITAS